MGARTASVPLRRAGAAGVVLALAAGLARAELNCDPGIAFHPGGGVRGCVLNGDHRLYTEGGVAVVCASGAWLEQHPDGTLARCTLRAPAVIEGQPCPAGSEVRFAPDGSLRGCPAAPPGRG